MAIEVYRTGLTGGRWSYETDEVGIEVVGDGAVRVEFLISSKGGGKTRLSVRPDADSFKELARAMVACDREAAENAFKAALRKRSPAT